MTVVDAGVNFLLDPTLPIIHAKIKMGTANYLYENALSIAEVHLAIEKGKNIVTGVIKVGKTANEAYKLYNSPLVEAIRTKMIKPV